MAIKTGKEAKLGDIYIDYPFEEVMFREDYKNQLIYKKFYTEYEILTPVPYDNRLYNDALRFGEEITKEEYEKGKISTNE